MFPDSRRTWRIRLWVLCVRVGPAIHRRRTYCGQCFEAKARNRLHRIGDCQGDWNQSPQSWSDLSIKAEYGSAATSKQGVHTPGGSLRIGCARRMAPQEGIQAAVNLSSGADQVVICTWLNGDWEGEGHDRPNMLLPGHTDTLTSAVAEANPQTMAVLQAGTPVEMSWLDKVSGLIQEWNGGNETGNAIADVLFGDYNPSEKLSLSWPATSKHNPA
jgi:beta-glucosidase